MAREITAEESAHRIEALFLYATNTGSAYPAFVRAVVNRYRAPWWGEASDAIARNHWNDAWKSAADNPPHWSDAPTPAEVLALALRLEEHFRAHVAENAG